MNPIQQHTSDQSERTPLGQILFDTGLISAEVLDRVLAEQRQTGQPLGQMLVEGGYVPARSVALALADQHGGALKTEYGFAVARPERRRALQAVASAPPDDAVPAEPVVVEEDPALAATIAQLEQDLNALREQLVTALAARGASEASEAALATRLAELEGASVRASATAAAELAEVRARVDQVSAVHVRTYAHDRHTVLLPDGERYGLVELDGAAPGAGHELELAGRRYRVLRVGPSPFPGEPRQCAFLEYV